MLDERLAQSSPCIIIITFSIALYRWLLFHKFSSLSRSDHVENNSFHAWCMKLSFHQVFIHPQRTPIEWVMSVLLRRCNLFKADFRLHIAQCFFHISLHGSSNSSIFKLMKTATYVFEVRWRWCTGLQFLWVWFSLLNLCLMSCMVSETWDFSHNLLF
jgi:hypothetical protein